MRAVLERKVRYEDHLRAAVPLVVEPVAPSNDDRLPARRRPGGARESDDNEREDGNGDARHSRYTATHGPDVPSCARSRSAGCLSRA